MQPHKFKNPARAIAALLAARELIENKQAQFVCLALARVNASPKLCNEVSSSLGSSDTLSNWLLDNHRHVYALTLSATASNGFTRQQYRLAWLDSMVENLQTNGTIYATAA